MKSVIEPVSPANPAATIKEGESPAPAAANARAEQAERDPQGSWEPLPLGREGFAAQDLGVVVSEAELRALLQGEPALPGSMGERELANAWRGSNMRHADALDRAQATAAQRGHERARVAAAPEETRDLRLAAASCAPWPAMLARVEAGDSHLEFHPASAAAWKAAEALPPGAMRALLFVVFAPKTHLDDLSRPVGVREALHWVRRSGRAADKKKLQAFFASDRLSAAAAMASDWRWQTSRCHGSSPDRGAAAGSPQERAAQWLMETLVAPKGPADGVKEQTRWAVEMAGHWARQSGARAQALGLKAIEDAAAEWPASWAPKKSARGAFSTSEETHALLVERACAVASAMGIEPPASVREAAQIVEHRRARQKEDAEREAAAPAAWPKEKLAARREVLLTALEKLDVEAVQWCLAGPLPQGALLFSHNSRSVAGALDALFVRENWSEGRQALAAQIVPMLDEAGFEWLEEGKKRSPPIANPFVRGFGLCQIEPRPGAGGSLLGAALAEAHSTACERAGISAEDQAQWIAETEEESSFFKGLGSGARAYLGLIRARLEKRLIESAATRAETEKPAADGAPGSALDTAPREAAAEAVKTGRRPRL
jgi:hypothetical protein